MDKQFIRVSLGIVALAAAGACHADGYGNIYQYGSGDTATVDQSGAGFSSGTVYQAGGSGNTGTVTQAGGTGTSQSGGVSQIYTTGSQGTVDQTANTGYSWGYVDQISGASMTGSVSQSGARDSWTYVWQSGNNSQASSTQVGTNNTTMWIDQGRGYSVGSYYGKNGFVEVDKTVTGGTANDSTANAYQSGSNSAGYILQYGGSNMHSYLSQYGDANTGGSLQSGSNLYATIYQGGSGGQASVYQTGVNWNGYISQYGSNNVASVRQRN